MRSRRKLRMTHEVQNADRKLAFSVVLLWCGVAVLAIVIALAIGNVLGDAASDKDPYDFSVYKYSGDDIPPIDAWQISLSGQTPEGLESTINSLPSSATAVSLYLRNEGGAPAYSSDVYTAVTGKASGSMSLKDSVDLLHQNGYYVSGCFDIGAPKLAGTVGCEALADFETSLLCEALESGIDELILLGLPSEQAGISVASSMFQNVRKEHNDAVLGAGINYQIMLSETGAGALMGYSEFADFCAVDTAGAKKFSSSAAQIAKSLAYVFETYPVRLLFEFSNDADRQAQAETLFQLGITNIQSHKVSVGGTPAVGKNSVVIL